MGSSFRCKDAVFLSNKDFSYTRKRKNSNSISSNLLVILIVLLMTLLGIQSIEASGTFGFDIHHRYSQAVQGYFHFDGLPEKGTPEYYSALAKRDRIIRGRHLADVTPVSFVDGNMTVQIDGLGYLYYANISVGNPATWFLVALDTGSDLFWLPCNCRSCVGALVSRSGQRIDLNIYSPNVSSTSMVVPCNSTKCGARRACTNSRNACAYQISYLSNGTSSTGVLVDDILHLATDDSQQKAVEAPITLGCGIVQTGGFLNGAAPNGLFGLGMDNISVPSTLASKGLAANSFSMCFGFDGIGRLVFGDKGTSDQGETPFKLHQQHPTYNISMTQIAVGDNVTNVNFNAIFDSGTSFTYVDDPAYSVIAQNFDSQVKEPRHQSDSSIPFEYCYDLSPTQTSFEAPMLNLTMEGGNQFSVMKPVEIFGVKGGGNIFCLGVLKSGDVNIIGQNFMTGYRIIFDREKMALGWKPSDCYDGGKTDNNGSNKLPINRNSTETAPSPAAVVPEATSGNRSGGGSPVSTTVPLPPSTGNSAAAPVMNFLALNLLFILFSFLGLSF